MSRPHPAAASNLDRRVDVFFYGLFMDADLLRQKGLRPQNIEPARVYGLALRIGKRATLVSRRSGCVHGIVMSLTLAELERLYAEPSVAVYVPRAVLAHLAGGGTRAALCYILPSGSRSRPNPDYLVRLQEVGRKVGLPAEYLDGLA